MNTALTGWLLPPNLITYARMATTPFIAWAVLSGQGKLAFFLVLAAGLSDGLDGFLARRYRWQSTVGAYLDPVADKLLLVTLYLVFAAVDLLPVWLVSLVFLRDLWILTMAAYAWFATDIRDFPPRWAGKMSTAAQLLLAGAILLRGAFPFLLPQAVVDLLVLAVTLLAGISGVDYTMLAIRRFAAWRRARGETGAR